MFVFGVCREKVYQARLYCENYVKSTGIRLDMRPYACGNICGCCNLFGCPTVSDYLTITTHILCIYMHDH